MTTLVTSWMEIFFWKFVMDTSINSSSYIYAALIDLMRKCCFGGRLNRARAFYQESTFRAAVIVCINFISDSAFCWKWKAAVFKINRDGSIRRFLSRFFYDLYQVFGKNSPFLDCLWTLFWKTKRFGKKEQDESVLQWCLGQCFQRPRTSRLSIVFPSAWALS